MIRFSTPQLEEKYKKILDIKIENYDEKGEEMLPDETLDYDDKMIQEMFEYCQNLNILDLNDSAIFKFAVQNNTTVRFLHYNIDEEIDTFLDKIVPFEFSSKNELRKFHKKLNTILNFEEFIEALIWETENDPEEVVKHFSRILDFDYSSLEVWNEKKESWMKEEFKIYEKIIERQLLLITNNIYPQIERKYNIGDYNIIHRELEFEVNNLNDYSIYDKFIFFEPNAEVPFVKLFLNNGEEIYKIYTEVENKNISDWINIDEKISNFVYDKDYMLILLNVENIYLECFLTEDFLRIIIPSYYPIGLIEEILKNSIQNKIGITVQNPKENSIELSYYLDHFPAIELTLLQYYLVNLPNSSLLIKEYSGEISSKTRKIKIHYKPVTDFFKEDFYIRYDDSNTKKLIIKGNNEKNCSIFFSQIFGRCINGFFLRQNALNSFFYKTIYGDNYIIDLNINKNLKKKKKTIETDAHLYTRKTKVEQLRNLITLPEDYSKYCQCKKQPIVLSADEVDDWLNTQETIFDKNNNRKFERSVKSYKLENGNVIYFTCSNEKHPDIHLVKSNDDPTLIPCCWDKRWEELIDPDDIVLAQKDYDKVITRKTTVSKTAVNNLQAFTYDNILDSADTKESYLFISQEIKQILLDITEEEITLVKPNPIVTKNSFLECILLALEDKTYPTSEYRKVIASKTSPYLFAQEAVGLSITPEKIYQNFNNSNVSLNSKLHYRAFEEYFNIHIFVFEMRNPNTKLYNVELDFILEEPYNKICCIRPLYPDRKCIILVKYNDEYNLISKIFPANVTRKMMNLFYYFHQTQIENSSSKITNNVFNSINWDIFFEKDPIMYQEIDIAGKTRIIQTESGITLYIPPTQPFNVDILPTDPGYIRTDPEYIINLFGEPESWDNKGFWYPLFGKSNQIYILTEDHNKPIENNNLIMLNPYVPEERIDKDYLEYMEVKKLTFVLIQIIQWAWRISNRPEFKLWFNKYVRVVTETENIKPEFIRISLPDQFESIRNGFSKISLWWPQMFSSDGYIKLWPSLRTNIEKFFENEEKIVGNYYEDPVPQKLVGIYTKSDDYPVNEFNRVFVGKEEFNLWSRIDRVKEFNNNNLIVYNIFDKESLDVIIRRENISRLYYRNHQIIIYNTESFDDAVKYSNGWRKNKRIIPVNLKETPKIVTLGFDKKFNLREIDEIGDDKNGRLYVLRYPDNKYAAVLQ